MHTSSLVLEISTGLVLLVGAGIVLGRPPIRTRLELAASTGLVLESSTGPVLSASDTVCTPNDNSIGSWQSVLG